MTAIIMQALRDHQAIINGDPALDLIEMEEARDSTEWLRDPATAWVFRAVGLDQRKIWGVMDEPNLLERIRGEIRTRPRRRIEDSC